MWYVCPIITVFFYVQRLFFSFIKSVVILLRLVLRYLTFFLLFCKMDYFFLITFCIWLMLMHRNTVVFYVNLYSAILVNSY